MNSKIIFIMGVSGVGKSTVGKLLSKELGVPFFDGDDFHPEENIKKMAGGTPLTDQDRLVWLKKLNTLAKEQLNTQKSSVIVCSALKKSYRNLITEGIKEASHWVFLYGSFEQIKDRLDKRQSHFMTAELLSSQFDILEEPDGALNIEVSKNPEQIVEIIKNMHPNNSEFSVFGLGVMGKSLARNLANKGAKLSLFNRHVEGFEENIALDFINEHPELSNCLPYDQLEPFVQSLQVPRKIMLMVPTGETLDKVIADLLPFLCPGDILIDGGNSHYKKTKERYEHLQLKGVHFIGVGVSGGEAGALKGPSIMPGGDKEIYKKVAPYLEKIAAKDKELLSCCSYIGPDGSGHFVKMVHNGIEYVEMQLLAEVYTLFAAMGYNPTEVSDILESWKTEANSYLLEITIEILRKREGSDWLLHKILDRAGNKGTGSWTTVAATELGIPNTLITSALFARYISFFKTDRVKAAKNFKSVQAPVIKLSSEDILGAYTFARIVNHHQGFALIKEASKNYKWELNLSELARIWTQGCIIRSSLMESLVDFFKTQSQIIESEHYVFVLNTLKPAIKKVVSQAIESELAIPSMTESISFLHSFSAAYSSANIIQAQRDYFGAHTYQRTDDPSGVFHHTQWNN